MQVEYTPLLLYKLNEDCIKIRIHENCFMIYIWRRNTSIEIARRCGSLNPQTVADKYLQHENFLIPSSFFKTVSFLQDFCFGVCET